MTETLPEKFSMQKVERNVVHVPQGTHMLSKCSRINLLTFRTSFQMSFRTATFDTSASRPRWERAPDSAPPCAHNARETRDGHFVDVLDGSLRRICQSHPRRPCPTDTRTREHTRAHKRLKNYFQSRGHFGVQQTPSQLDSKADEHERTPFPLAHLSTSRGLSKSIL